MIEVERTGQPRRWRRWLGVFLILYGLVGLALAAGGAVLVSASFRGIDRVADAVATQRNVLVLTLDATATSIRNAAEGTASVDAVLEDAADATRQAATMTRSLAAAADEVALAATFQILGQQPFATVAASFTRVAADARTLADQLDGAGDTLGGTTADTRRVRDDLGRVATQVGQFSSNLAESEVLDDLEAGFDPPRIVLYGLLGWLGVQAFAAIVAGVALIVGARRRPVVLTTDVPNPF